MNKISQKIQFVLFGNVYTYFIKYVPGPANSFNNDLILFGMFLEKNQLAVIKNINHFVVNYWMDRDYEIELE